MGMKSISSIAISILLLLPAPVLADEATLSFSNDRLEINVSDEVRENAKKAKALEDYEVIDRVRREVEGYLGGLPETARTEIEISGFRLRSGVSGFFGMSGSDTLDARVTIRDDGKQIGHFVVNADNGRSGKTQPPTRRVIRLVQEFGQIFGIQLQVSQGNMPMPFFPGNRMRH